MEPGASSRRVEHRSLYAMRHTYASLSIAAGVCLFELSRLMGTSPAMLDKTYGHMLPDALDRARVALQLRRQRKRSMTDQQRELQRLDQHFENIRVTALADLNTLAVNGGGMGVFHLGTPIIEALARASSREGPVLESIRVAVHACNRRFAKLFEAG